jgi:hypothetical protein
VPPVTSAGFTLSTLGAGHSQLLLCIPACNRHIGWLIAPDGRVLTVPGDDSAAIAIPVRLEFEPGTDNVRLQHSLRRRWYLGHKSAAEDFGFRQKPQEFGLLPVDAAQTSPVASGIADELASALTAPVYWATLLDAVRTGRLRAALADAALRCLPMDELDHLARHLLESPEDLALLQSAMPGDAWLRRRLPALVAWRHAHARSTARATLSGPDSTADLPGAKANPSHRITLGLVVNGFARSATPPRRMACVLATARNEGAYLLEWIAYHRAIGFAHIFLYTNDNTDGSDDMLQLLADAGIITWFRNQVQPDTLPQHRAYGHALSVMPDILDYRWTMVADIDEFAGFDTTVFKSMPDYILWQEQRRAEAIALSWKVHVAAPVDIWRDKPSIQRFTLREAAISSYVKTIFRTNLASNANPHHPEPRIGTSFIHRSELGAPFVQRVTPAQSAVPSAQLAWISHYPFRSAPEMLMKLARGRADQPAALQSRAAENRVKTFVNQLYGSKLIEDRTTLRCGALLADERQKLMTIPNLAACETEIKRAYVVNMRQAHNEFLDRTVDTKSEHIAKLTKLMQTSLAA